MVLWRYTRRRRTTGSRKTFGDLFYLVVQRGRSSCLRILFVENGQVSVWQRRGAGGGVYILNRGNRTASQPAGR